MYNFDNYSHEYKTRRIFELRIKSCYLSSGFFSLLAVNHGVPGVRDNLSFIALSPKFCSRLLIIEGCPSHPLVFTLFMWNSQPR